MALDYANSPSRTTEFDIFGTGSGDIRTKDTTHQFGVRPGVGYVYAPYSRIYLDYQYEYFTDDTGTLAVNRFYTGIDHEFAEFFHMRGGTVIDTHGNVSVAGGIGIYSSSVFIDIAYQYNMFPEVSEEFGTAQSFGISVSIPFGGTPSTDLQDIRLP